MNHSIYLLLLLPILAFAQYPVSPNPITQFEEQRYCGTPIRNSDGTIKRSAAVLTAFRKQHPCPVTGLTYGACPGWALDHTVSLVCGGCDAVSNLSWMPNAIKSCAASTGIPCKDRWEQSVYCKPEKIVK